MFTRSSCSVLTLLTLLMLLPTVVSTADTSVSPRLTVASPGEINRITVQLVDGVPTYRVDHGGTPVILPSRLGFEFADAPALASDLTLADVQSVTGDTTWEQPWGEVREVRDRYHGLRVTFASNFADPWGLVVEFRAYDDGIAFRYEIPASEVAQHLHIMDERTEFALAGDHDAWFIKAFQWNRYEYLYETAKVSELDTVHTPVTMLTGDGLALSFHEAALTDFSSMALRRSGGTTLEAELFPWSDGVKVRGDLPLKSPWRTLQIGDTPGDLITSPLILNLNEPSRIEDTSWIEPGKYVGIWWEMHLDVATWASGERHGATTANARRYIDFASRFGFDGVLVEGWNVGWDGNWIANAEKFSFTEPYPDYDLHGLAEYAREQGVRLIAHNETSTGILNYEQQAEEAFALYRELGIRAIKTGYVGHSNEIKRRDPETGEVLGTEWHHGQFMVNHYRHITELAAKHGLMLDVHEPIKDTGIRRTWPNLMTREGARGQEFNAWAGDGGNPPDHTTILPFTRMLAGPFDQTPGIFNLLLEGANRPDNRVNTTLAKQLALYVVIYSPLHMAADLPDAYLDEDGEPHPMFQFIVDVPTDWERTEVLNGRIGDYVTIARQQRGGDDWYIGSVTDEQARSFLLPLEFLDEGREYEATIYADGENADWERAPLLYSIRSARVTRESLLPLDLAAGGGAAVRIVPVE